MINEYFLSKPFYSQRSLSSRISYLIAIFFLFAAFPIGFPERILADEPWQEIKGDHFIVYFLQDERFAKDVLSNAEDYYKNIASELGYQRYSDFWTWDKRVPIYIHADHASFIQATGQPSWSQGLADYRDKKIISYAWSKDFLEALLPHEIAHLIFRDYVGFKGEIPLWLDEGVAQWMEPKKREVVGTAVRELLTSGKSLPLASLLTLNMDQTKDEEQVRAFYIEAMSLVNFLVNEYGSESFISFCRQLRDGKSFDESLIFSYPTSIRSIKELEDKWHQYIRESREE